MVYCQILCKSKAFRDLLLYTQLLSALESMYINMMCHALALNLQRRDSVKAHREREMESEPDTSRRTDRYLLVLSGH